MGNTGTTVAKMLLLLLVVLLFLSFRAPFIGFPVWHSLIGIYGPDWPSTRGCVVGVRGARLFVALDGVEGTDSDLWMTGVDDEADGVTFIATVVVAVVVVATVPPLFDELLLLLAVTTHS